MKHYRIQARSSGEYHTVRLDADNDKDALLSFKKMVDEGTTHPDLDEKFYYDDRTFVTYEEVSPDVTTKVSSGETGLRARMGKTSVETEHGNPQHAVDGYKG